MKVLEKITNKHVRIVLFVMVLLNFGGSMRNGYAWDDELVTTPENVLVSKGIRAIPEIFSGAYSSVNGMAFGYRPITVSSFAVEYSIFGFNPTISHLLNLVLYLLVVLLVFKVLLLLLKDSAMWVSALIALIFAVHPLHNEVVVSLKNREEILVAIAAFTALWAFIKFANTKQYWWLAIGALVYFTAFFIKPTIYPFMLLIPFAMWNYKIFTGKSAFALLSLLVFAGVVYTAIMIHMLGMDGNRALDYVENPMVQHPFSDRFPLMFSVVYNYLRLIVLPYPLIAYYGLGQVTIPDWSTPSVWAGILFSLGFLLFIIKSFRSRSLLFFGLVFTVISISPYLNIVWLAPGVMAERFAFFPVLGMACIAVALAQSLAKYQALVISALTLVLCIFTGINLSRTSDWKNKEHLLEVDAAKAPNSVKIQTAVAEIYHTKMGQAHSAAEQIEYAKKAETGYRNVIRLYPENCGVYQNLGTLQAAQQRLKEAESNLLKAISLGCRTADTYYNLGAVYELSAKREKALEEYKKAVVIDPSYQNALDRISTLESVNNP